MYKNQLQELAQRSCFNLPSYSCIREGPDHAPRFKATVNFNGESFESPTFYSTLRQAEHVAAGIALNTLATRGTSKALAARVLDETGVYKNLLQETAQKAGLNLPVYTTFRTSPGCVPVFSCTIELAGLSFTGEPARTKKYAQKNAAMAAWSTLKRLSQHVSTVSTSSSLEAKCNEEQDQVVIARFLSSMQQSESKHFMQNDWQHGHQRSLLVCKDLALPASSLYSEQCQSLAYPYFPPEMALYQMCQQEQLLQLQNHLLTLPVTPAPPIAPQILPYMQSVFPPNHVPYVPAGKLEPLPVAVGPRFSAATSSPSLYLSSQSVQEPIRIRSMLTIQEIYEKKTEESSKCSTASMVPESPVPVHTNAESRIKDPNHEDGNQKNVDLEKGKISLEVESGFENLQIEGNQSRQSEWNSHGKLDSGFRLDNLQLQNSCGPDSSHSYCIPQCPPRVSAHGSPRLPPCAAPPVMIRTVGPVSSARPVCPIQQNLTSCSLMPAPPRVRTGAPLNSTRPGTRNVHIRQVNPRFLAPAVRIRTVVPVCSAPPPRQTRSSNQEATLPDRGKKNTVQEDVLTATSELDKLHM